MRGVVVKYDQERGFGFISSEEYSEDVFVHISNVVNSEIIFPGQKVDFIVEESSRGLHAFSVHAGNMQRSPYFLFGTAGAVLTVVVTAIMLFFTGFVVSYLLGINVATYFLYHYDKYAVKVSRLRVPENILHVFTLFGGSIMAFTAQVLLRHKTVKKPFQYIFWAIIFIHITFIFAFLFI